MSGSGSGGGGGGGGGHVSEGMNCSALTFRTPLNSPKPDVLATLSVGDRLRVVLVPPKGPVEVRTTKDRVAGSITSIQMVQLMNCINKGYEYEAEVKSLSGGRCDIEIRVKK
jgi:hypothetical protein